MQGEKRAEKETNFHGKPKCLTGGRGSDHKISQTQLNISPGKVVIIVSISKKFLRNF